MQKSAFLILAVCLAAPAFAGGGETAEKAPKPKKERPICKTVPSSHSRMGIRICRTRAQWDGTQERKESGMEDLEGATKAR